MLSNKMNSSFLFEDKPHLIRGRKTKKEALKSSTMGAKEKAKEKEREKDYYLPHYVR